MSGSEPDVLSAEEAEEDADWSLPASRPGPESEELVDNGGGAVDE